VTTGWRRRRSLGFEFIQPLLYILRRFEFERLFISRDGLVVKALYIIRQAQIDLSFDQIGFQFERLFEGCDGLVITSFITISHSEVEVRFRDLRIKPGGLIEGADRFFIERETQVGPPQIVVGQLARAFLGV
jgi:hypothetical protein